VLAALFLPNLLVFVVGQAAAWYYLRTGRYWSGVLSTSALWVLLDWWLIARFVHGADPVTMRWPALSLQAVALAVAGALAFGLWRRRWSRAARQRQASFGAGMVQMLRGEHAAARTTFTRLVRVDPWDAAAWIALGDAHGGAGEAGRAQRCYRRASSVDTQRAFADLLQLRRRPPRAG
jgi:hypothetical protein